MTPIVRAWLALIALACAAVPALAAEGGKLRFVAAIYLDGKGTGMRNPEGLACNDRGALVVADTGTNRLLRYTVDDGAAKPAGEIQVPQLSAPIVVQLGSKDEVFALDGKQRRIVRFDAKGEYQGPLAPEGVPAPATIVPRSFRVDKSDAVYVLDVFSARVLVLGADGKYQRHIAFPKEYGFFSDLAVDGKGSVFLIDSLKATIHAAAKDAKEFRPLGKPLRGHASFPTAITVDARGVLYVVDQNGAGIVLVGPDGTVMGRQLAMGWTDGLLYYPSHVCVSDKGHVFVADRGNNRVQVFRLAR